MEEPPLEPWERWQVNAPGGCLLRILLIVAVLGVLLFITYFIGLYLAFRDG